MTYCTVNDVKAQRNITNANSDAVLTSLCAAVTAAIDSYCSRDFLVHNGVSEVRNGHGGSKMMPLYGPLKSVTSVVIDGINILPAQGTGPGFLYDEDVIYLRGYTFCRGVQNIAFAYDGGFQSVPADVKDAAIEWVLTKYDRISRPDKATETIGGQTVTFNTKAMPDSVRCTLNKYRRWFV